MINISTDGAWRRAQRWVEGSDKGGGGTRSTLGSTRRRALARSPRLRATALEHQRFVDTKRSSRRWRRLRGVCGRATKVCALARLLYNYTLHITLCFFSLIKNI